MDAITKSLDEIRFEIPRQLLQYAFVGNGNTFSRVPVSLDSRIKEEVIQKRVIVDCSLQGGVHDTVKLSKLTPTVMENGWKVYKIPDALIGGRKIMSTIAVGNSGYIAHAYGGIIQDRPDTGTPVGATQALFDAHRGVQAAHSTNVRLIGDNVVLVEDDLGLIRGDLWLHCVVGNDNRMSELPPKAYHVFSELVVLATKAWIYNNCDISMDRGALIGGVELGRMREVLDSYADSNQIYKELMRSKWSRIAILSDKTAKKKHIRFITPTQ